jgi:hypothetical protein
VKEAMMLTNHTIKHFAKRFVKRRSHWSIGIYWGASLFDFANPDHITNPVLTADQVTDVPADFVADPFMLRVENIWHMFFEVLNTQTERGEIGLATSWDGFSWNYQQIVLREPFHLSYPYVFKWQDDYYMIPETASVHSIRLYKATHFPDSWEFTKVLMDGETYADPSIFYFNQRWWLFTATSSQRNVLRLYHATDLMGDWVEHPHSPIVNGNTHIARPGGRVIPIGDRVIRYAQDCEPVYGRQIRAFEITELTTNTYHEKAYQIPILKGSGVGWNATGMHTIDPHPMNERQWIACVDGYYASFVFGLQHSDSS